MFVIIFISFFNSICFFFSSAICWSTIRGKSQLSILSSIGVFSLLRLMVNKLKNIKEKSFQGKEIIYKQVINWCKYLRIRYDESGIRACFDRRTRRFQRLGNFISSYIISDILFLFLVANNSKVKIQEDIFCFGLIFELY